MKKLESKYISSRRNVIYSVLNYIPNNRLMSNHIYRIKIKFSKDVLLLIKQYCLFIIKKVFNFSNF